MRDLVKKAEIRLGKDGKVKELGVQLEEEIGDDKIWFTRIEWLDGGETKPLYAKLVKDVLEKGHY